MRTGAGKTTTMRMILDLARPTTGAVTVNGKPFAGLFSAMIKVSALPDAATALRLRNLPQWNGKDARVWSDRGSGLAG
jgi:ABC-type oligopeptide transport system ATPase subunit